MLPRNTSNHDHRPSSKPVAPERRFTRSSPCPICGGYDSLSRRRGARCHGFLSRDGRYAHCSREEHGGGLPVHMESGTIAHRLDGTCRCGVTHSAVSSVDQRCTGRVLTSGQFYRCPRPYPCDYTDEGGEVLYRVARWPRRDGGKSYSMHRPGGHGLWLSGLNDVRRVVYGLPEIRAAIASR